MEKIKLTYDKEITIATARSNNSKNWQNKAILISELFSNLGNPHRTKETVEEFKNADKDTRNKIKNCIGGFVGGALKQNGSRTKDNIQNRVLITLDIDQCNKSIEEYLKSLECLYCIYSTHSHREDYKRYRLIIPLDRAVTPVEYEAVARMQASVIDKSMDMFDDTTYQPIRLMYWASIPKDADYYFKYNDGPLLKADDVLAKYTFGWEDISSWPRSKRSKIRAPTGNKPQDPTTKTGYIGAFCRAYSITESIEKFLSDEYEPGKNDTRYTYTKGQSSNGLEIFDNNTFAFSYQDTDPISGKGACNAFDLVRLHKFGQLDSDYDLEHLESKELKSFKRMCEFVANDEKAKSELLAEDFKKVENNTNKLKLDTKRDIKVFDFVDSLKSAPIKKPSFLVHRLIYDKGINLLVGDPKTFKTYVALDIAIGVITGTQTLGHEVLKKGKVLLISTELDVRDRIISLINGRNLETDVFKNNLFMFDYNNSLDSFEWNKDRDTFEDMIVKLNPDLVILDPISYIFDGEITDNDEVKQFFRELKEMINKYNFSVILTHHNNRMKNTNRNGKISGAAAFSRHSDSVIHLEKFNEDEKQDINKSDEELDLEVKPIKLIKGDYRFGLTGYRYYTINFSFSDASTVITATKLEIDGTIIKNKKESESHKKATREEDIFKRLVEKCKEGKFNPDGMKKTEIALLVNNIYDVADSTYRKNLADALNILIKDGYMEMREGYRYYLINKNIEYPLL